MLIKDFLKLNIKQYVNLEPSHITRFYLPKQLIEAAEEALLFKGRFFFEEMIIIAGYTLSSWSRYAVASTIIHPETISSYGEVELPSYEIPAIAEAIFERGARIFFQIHTHPDRWCNLSLMDRRYPFFTALQIVVPDYGRHGIFTPWTRIYEPVGVTSSGLLRARQLSKAEIQERFWLFDLNHLRG